MVKMVHGICALLLLLISAGQAFVQTAKTAKISLIEVGDIYDEGVSVKNGERWLGLYVTEGGSSLIESKVTVKPLLDPEDKKTVIGKIVAVDNPAKPVFLVKGATVLKPGPAPTIYQGGDAAEHELVNTENLASRKPRQLKLGDSQEYQLKVLATKARPGEFPCPKCVDLKLALVFGKQTQTLYSAEAVDPENSPQTWRLLWAGDADGDGKMDLYASFSSDAVGAHTELFLSSQAKPGQLVKSVATFVSDAP